MRIMTMIIGIQLMMSLVWGVMIDQRRISTARLMGLMTKISQRRTILDKMMKKQGS